MDVRRRARNERGVVFPSPVVILSVVAVAMAGIAFVATRDGAPPEKEISHDLRAPGQRVADARPDAHRAAEAQKPKVDRSKVYVVVFNNSNAAGLAGRVAAQASQIGWQVVGSDNWYGTIPASTVYYPQRLRAGGQAARPRPGHPADGARGRPDAPRPAHRHPDRAPRLDPVRARVRPCM